MWMRLSFVVLDVQRDLIRVHAPLYGEAEHDAANDYAPDASSDQEVRSAQRLLNGHR